MDRLEVKNVDYLIPICVFGEAGVGKTSLIYRFREDLFEEMAPTVGVEFTEKVVTVKDRSVKLQCWDTTGETRFRSTVKQYFRQKAACSIVISYDNRESLFQFENWVTELKELAHPAAVITLVVNKCDIPVKERSFSKEEALSAAEKFDLWFFECSAKTGTGVAEPFKFIAEEVLRKIELGEVNPMEPSTGIRTNAIRISEFMLTERTALRDDPGPNSPGFFRKVKNSLKAYLCPKKVRTE